MSNNQALLALSMKGGVGKTTTAIGLARALHLARDPGYEPLY